MRKEKGVELLQTTRCFAENDTLFYWKRYVVLLKTTRCFIENDTLFYWKRHVVLLKTIRCFWKNNTFKGTNWTLIFRPLWHLWQQKSKIAVGCACVRTREASLALGDASQNTKIWGTFFVGKIRIWERTMWSTCEGYLFEIALFCFLWFAKLVFISRGSAFYREFFTLCTYISPYTNRGARNEKHLIHRKKQVR